MKNIKSLSQYVAVIISSATLRLQDTIPAMLEALSMLAEENEYLSAVKAQYALLPFGFIPSHALEDDSAEFWESEDAVHRYEELFDLLAQNAPAGYYFGTNESDPAELGFWPIFEPCTQLEKGYFLARIVGEDPDHYYYVSLEDFVREDWPIAIRPKHASETNDYQELESALKLLNAERKRAFEAGKKAGYDEGYTEGKESVEREFGVGSFNEEHFTCTVCQERFHEDEMSSESETDNPVCKDCKNLESDMLYDFYKHDV